MDESGLPEPVGLPKPLGPIAGDWRRLPVIAGD
jgi:hypothetical protein